MSLSDYSTMEQDIRNAPQPHILPKGVEVKLRIIRVQPGISQKEGSEGAKWLMPYFDVPSDPMAKEFNTFLYDPMTVGKLSNPKAAARCLSDFSNFTKCFGIDLSKPFDAELDWPGKEGWAILGVSPDDGYGEKNNISRFVTGPVNNVRSSASQTQNGSAGDIPF